LTLIGSIQNGLVGDDSFLLLKATLDGFASLALATTFGFGVIFSVIVIAVYQGGLSLGAGLFAAVRRPSCSVGAAGAGGIAGLFGIACPTCNKVLALFLTGEVLLASFDPLRPYVAGFGVLILAAATGRELVLRRRQLEPPFAHEARR
jgi:uncharacterized membrane protein YqgA involved in biofilm formation